MSLRSEVIALQDLEGGDAIGYGSRYRTDVPIRVAVVACGYADGYPRHAPDGTPVWVAGARGLADGKTCLLAGQVSMDMITVDLENCPNAKIGDPVTLWGDGLPVEEIARYADTIPYTLVCGITQRVSLLEAMPATSAA